MNISQNLVAVAVTTTAALALLPLAPAQSKPADKTAELERKRDAKLAQDWIRRADWVLDFDEAQKLAKKDGKLVFAYFTRSYEP